MMSYRSKRTRTAAASKVKDSKIRSVEDVVAQVVHDVAIAEAQDEETLRSSCGNPTTDQPAMNQPTQATYTEEDNVRPNLRKTSARESLAPSPNQPFSTDPSPRFRSGRRWSPRVLDNGVQANHGVAPKGAQALETQVSSSCNVWVDTPSMTEPRQPTTTEVNDFRPSKRSSAGRQIHTPPPSQPLPADSPSQPRASKRKSVWVEDDDDEPFQEFQQGLSQGRRSKPAKWRDDIEFDEMEEVEMRGNTFSLELSHRWLVLWQSIHVYGGLNVQLFLFVFSPPQIV